MATRQNAIPVGLIILALSAGCASPAGGDPTDLPEPLATAAALPEVDPPTTPAVAVATATPTDFMAQPTGTFAAGGMIIPTKTLHPEGYTFEDSDIRSDLRTLRPELNELQPPFATAVRGTAEAQGRFPSATPWPFPVTPNPTPILDSWIVGDPATQASALEVYTDLLTFVVSSGQLSVEEFSEGLKEYMIYDAEVNPGGYCKYEDIVEAFRALKRQGRYIRFRVPSVELIESGIGLPTMQLHRDSSGKYYSVMKVLVIDPVIVEVVDAISSVVLETRPQRDALQLYFLPRLEAVDGGVIWKLYSGEVPIGCYR